MYRQIFIPDEQNHVINIPSKWYGHRIEVIVFPIDEKPEDGASLRKGWAEAARQMHASGDDNILMPEAPDNENTDWWTWEEKKRYDTAGRCRGAV
jgi:hypothetical protein